MKASELPSGLRLRIPYSIKDTGAYSRFPHAVVLNVNWTFFLANGWSLGEFGSFYVALHIIGNLVRYYPDIWMPHVENSTSFALLVQELCELAASRLPILTASELDRCYYFGGDIQLK